MIRKRITALILCLSLILGFGVLAAGGSEGESLVTLSYLKQIFSDGAFKKAEESGQTLKNNATTRLDNALASAVANATSRMDSILAATVEQKVIDKILSQPEVIIETKTEQVNLYKGDRIIGRPGAGIILQSGTGSICGPSGSEVLNVTTGSTRKPGFDIKDGIYYMVLESDGSGVEITSVEATALIKDGAYIVRGYKEQYTVYADMLYDLGLFKGTGSGYELVRAPNRQEALIMLIRLLGEEQIALKYDASKMTFKDVVGWEDGKRYIAYGAAMKYTNGVSKTEFGQHDTADANMYLTFVLRALGYKDSGTNPDFVWNKTSQKLAVEIGLLTEEQCADMVANGLRRDHVVLISVNALFKAVQGEGTTLAEKLVKANVFTQEQLNSVIEKLLAIQ